MYLIYVMCAFTFAAAKSGTEEPESVKANNYLLEKWTMWHTKILDIDHDEFVTLEDLEILKQKFASHGVSDNTISRIDKLWRTTILSGHSKLSREEFVQMLKEKYESDQTKFVQTMQTLNKRWFEAIDINKDGVLSIDEYVADIKAFKHEDTKKDNDFYNSHRLVDRLVPMDEVEDVWVRFLCEKDKAKTDIVVEALKHVA